MAGTPKERMAQLSALRDRGIAFMRLLKDIGLPEKISAEAEAAIQTAYERRDLRGLKMVSRDLNAWMNDLDPATREKFDESLRPRFGEDPRGLEEQARELSCILDRGTIENEEEYRLLADRADEIYADESKSAEFQEVSKLMTAFEEELAAKGSAT